MIPLRVDAAGGWLDVPKFARPGGLIVNCTIEPFEARWGGGLGGSAHEGLEAELARAGWQDAAVIEETGLCVWRSGPLPVLEAKYNPDFLRGLMALLWTGKPHDTKSLVDMPRDYNAIYAAGSRAAPCKWSDLRAGIDMSYRAQVAEGMPYLPMWTNRKWSQKYCGAGWGGYALYLFADTQDRAEWLSEAATNGYEARGIEPYMRGYA